MQTKNGDRYYPESLIRAYFNWCHATDHPATWNGLDDFAKEIQGEKHINGIPSFLTIEEIFNNEIKQSKNG